MVSISGLQNAGGVQTAPSVSPDINGRADLPSLGQLWVNKIKFVKSRNTCGAAGRRADENNCT